MCIAWHDLFIVTFEIEEDGESHLHNKSRHILSWAYLLLESGKFCLPVEEMFVFADLFHGIFHKNVYFKIIYISALPRKIQILIIYKRNICLALIA
jgi:hypothetical protein